MNRKITIGRDFHSLLLNVFGFLLLWEWLRPLRVVTDTSELNIFVVFIGVCFLLLFLQLRTLWVFFIKVFVILFTIHSVYYEGSFLEINWIRQFFLEVLDNIFLLFQANWWEMTPVFRSFLFYILLWLMCYLLHFWLTKQKKIFLFFVLTIIYITVLDTFSPYDAKNGIIRTIIIGFIMLGYLRFERLRVKEQLRWQRRRHKNWLFPLVVFVFLSTTVGYFTPKASPQWPDPVPYLTGYGESSGGSGNGVKKIGYGTNNSNLGGPFIPDDTIVFTVDTKKRHYWRVETKDVYTGKGWETSSNPEAVGFLQENTVLDWYEPKAELEDAEAQIDMYLEYPHITYPAGLTSVETEPDVSFSVNPLTEKINTFRGSTSINLSTYHLSYQVAKFPINHLQEVTQPGGRELEQKFIELYTQLPETLPQRVRDLAIEITAPKTNRYDKVKAVEQYFKMGPYVYDTVNTAVPSKDEDYVDQFIFDTKIGYCDNFSTSMIVLLRAAGIPSRWVKGYSEGERYEVNKYEITNNNAHSWVEVYFPGFGWVPFEPTKGFNNSYLFNYDLETTGTTPQSTPEQTPRQPLPLEGEEKEEEAVDTNTKSAPSWFVDMYEAFSWKYFLLIVGSILMIGFLLFKNRAYWLPYLFIMLYKHRKDEKVYFKAYHALLKQLARNGLVRKEGQTLRDFARYIDTFYETQEMEQLTRSYERAVYRKDSASSEWEKSVELWENLIKKVPS